MCYKTKKVFFWGIVLYDVKMDWAWDGYQQISSFWKMAVQIIYRDVFYNALVLTNVIKQFGLKQFENSDHIL